MAHKNHSPTTSWTERPVFQENQRLTPERLNRILEYQTQRLRLMQLGLAGAGIVYGFNISVDDDNHCKIVDGKIEISCGLAFDCYGRQLYWPGGWIGIDDICGQHPECAGNYTLSLHYAEKSSNSDGRCGCDENETDWVKEGVVFTLKKGCCDTDCQPCPHEYCKHDECDDICDYICAHSDKCITNLCENPKKLCDIACGEYLFDGQNELPLACVTIDEINGDCEPKLVFDSVKPDYCDERSYVHRNPLLYELIQGCHLDYAKVASLSWQEWLSHCDPESECSETTESGLQTVSWDDFCKRADPKSSPQEGFTIEFTKPIRISTLHQSSVFFTILIQERRTDYWEPRRVPLDDIKFIAIDGYAPSSGYTKRIRLLFDKEWMDAEVNDKRSTLTDGFIVELTIHGSMLRDKCCQMLDAVPLDYNDVNYRREMLGDDFVAAFCVSPRGKKRPKKPSAKSE